MAAKIFQVSDVLPATTQLKIMWDSFQSTYVETTFVSTSTGYDLIYEWEDNNFCLNINNVNIYMNKTTYPGGNVIIDTSSWSEAKRTISYVDSLVFTWEDLNAPSGYTISFNSNGGSTIPDIEGVTELPTLPTPTKSGYTFVAWYYESNFQTRAKAGDTIEANTTLYAKWHNLGSLFTEIADAIRSKDGTSESIRDVDFGERVKQIQGAKEEETKTVTPNFSSGNEVVTPTSGKVLSQVTINKDSNLIADNIKKDVTVHGITGTLASGSGTSVDRIGIICFEFYSSKSSSTTKTLTYEISSEMLSKTFFTDGEGNWYLPEDVSVYYRDTYKGKADTALTLFSGTGTFSGYSVTFKVGTTPVALLLYFYSGDDDVFSTGFHSGGYLRICWDSATDRIKLSSEHTEFIELPGNFFDDFPYYSSSSVDYWKKENFFSFLEGKTSLGSGWTLDDYDDW